MALYHKHRPQNFSTVIGQDHIVQTLANEVVNNKVAHAYLFSGPRGVGKTTLARILAKAVNCENRKAGSSEPCGVCQSCEDIGACHAIDVIEIDAASHTGVDNVRDNIIDNARYKPTKSKYKVFIIDEVHMLSTNSFNALLKTLEEPPEYVIFVLATTELHKIPETIVSRCQRFSFKRIGHDVLKKHLNNLAKAEEIKIDKEIIERIINKSDGCARDAISLLDQVMAIGEKDITAEMATLVLPTANTEKTLEFVSALIDKDKINALLFINNLSDVGLNYYQFSYDVIELLRILMISSGLQKSDGLGIDLDDETKKQLFKLNEKISPADLVRLIDLLIQRAGQIKSSPMPQLPLEMAVVEWCSTTDNNSTDDTDDKKTETIIKTREQEEKPIEDSTNKITIKEKVKNLVTKSPAFSLEDIEKNWSVFIRKIEMNLPSLSFILKMANLKQVDGNTVKVSVGFDFHRDKLMEKKNLDSLEDTLSEIMTGKVKFDCLVEQSAQTQEKEELQNLASSFGGEVIN